MLHDRLLSLYLATPAEADEGDEAEAEAEADTNLQLGFTHTDVDTLLREETADRQLDHWCRHVAEALWP